MDAYLKKLTVGQKIFILPLFFAATLIGIVLYTVITLDQQAADFTVINIAGRQRMLAQKFTKEVLEELNTNQVKISARKITEIASTQIKVDRGYYTEHVIGKLKRAWPDFKASTHHQTEDGAIPFPATYVQEVSDVLKEDAGYSYTLKSKWNINSTKGLSEGFETNAWNALSENPNKPFIELEKTEEGLLLHYATSDVAAPGCVSCHNKRSDSPKRDFSTGDLMGILVVSTLATSDAYLAEVLMAGETAEKASDKTAELFSTSLKALLQGGTTYSDLGMTKEVLLPANRDKGIEKALIEVQESWQKLRTASNEIWNYELNSVPYLEQLDIIRSTNLKTLKQMNEAVSRLSDHSSGKLSNMMTIEWVILVLALGACLWFGIVVTRLITASLKIALKTTTSIANGNLDLIIDSDTKDETGKLLDGLHTMQNKLSNVIEKDIQSIVDAAREGDLTQRVSLSGKEGFYKTLSAGINDLVDVNKCVIDDTARVFGALAKGDLSQSVDTQYKGSYEQLKQDANATTKKIRSVIECDIQSLVDAAKEGDLSQRIEISNKDGFFKSLSLGINELIDTVENVFDDVATTMGLMADGELTQPIKNDYKGSYDLVKQNINKSMHNLEQTISRLRQSGDLISSSAGEILVGNNDLSAQTEQQASSLEETSSNMRELTSTVKNNANNAQEANKLASNARQTAQVGGEVVGRAATAMHEINSSSQKIVEIIAVIDEIAFQTNLLALNASVEAARAGEQGRGFAVVASEVRNLAGRSATAAKEIKDLIDDSVQKVNIGVDLVSQSGENLDEIVDSIKKVSNIVSDIVAVTSEQTDSIGQVNSAVSKIDGRTHQNAALAERTSAAAGSMSNQSNEMMELMEFFTVSGNSSSTSSAPMTEELHQVTKSA